jgi:hypothetical protein
MDPRAALLRAAASGVSADTAEAGLARLGLPDAQPALAGLIAEGLVRDPVRLEPGALQCHWRLELTPAGREAMGRLTGD